MTRISLPFLLIIFFLTINPICAQQLTKEEIIRTNNFFHGSGKSFDIGEARDQALKGLTQQISVTVASSFEHKVKETSSNLEQDVQSIMSTHSRATLRNVKTIKAPLETGEISVFCYIKKSEVEKIFEDRKKLITEISAKADENEKQYNVAYALKLNYFALLLVNSLPDESVIYDSINYTTKLPERINHIIQNILFEFQNHQLISENERIITLNITYKDKPVSLIDFSFWDGSNQVSVQGRDGVASFHLFGGSINFKSLKLNTKIAYYESRNEYNIVSELWNLVEKPKFNTLKEVDLKTDSLEIAKLSDKINAQKTDSISSKWDFNLTFSEPVPCIDSITKSTSAFLDMLTEHDEAAIITQYQNDRFLQKKMLDYLKYNHADFPNPTIDAKINKTATGYELRKLQMQHRYPSINKQTTEFLVLDFSKQGELVDINLSITENLYNEFVEQSKFANDWKERQQIIKFVEKYRTAYQTRDINTVSLLFAEDALIIIGREIKRKKVAENTFKYRKFNNQPDIEYLKFSKKEYINRQKAVFKKQSDIFLDFSDFDIVQKNNAKNVYGVEMRQSYTSTTYADEGYLFLLIDFSEHDPLIYVRAWQPNEWDKESLVKTANFRIYK